MNEHIFLQDCATCGTQLQKTSWWHDLLYAKHMVACHKCSADSGWQETPETAASVWNERQATLKVRHCVSKHYAMYNSGVSADEICQFESLTKQQVGPTLDRLVADGKIEEQNRGGQMKYYPLADERAKYFPMETPEEMAGMEW